MLAAVQNALSAIVAPVLSREERCRLEQKSDRALCDAIGLFGAVDGTIDETQYQLVQRRDELAVYRAKATRAGACCSSDRLVASGFIHGRLEDVTSALYCDDDEDLLMIETLLSGASVFDGAVLNVSERRSQQTPFRFAGIKWYALQCRGRPSDLLTYERMGVTLAHDNTDVAYHVVHALEGHQDWPNTLQRWSKRRTTSNQRSGLPTSLHRLEPFTLCYLYRRVSTDLVQCFIVGDYVKNRKDDVNLEAILVDRMLMVTNTVASHEAKRLAQMIEDCRETPVIWQLDSSTRSPETDAFCVKCLQRANISSLPSDFAAQDKAHALWYYGELEDNQGVRAVQSIRDCADLA
ncbi:hypothetical protein P43SY_008336 [Pythium insidiosum]|uniref:Uncharacterized protein n=1 Tax=Pythium insidiosum TaxID=114742 RepID=A0AAD5LFC0_PYTIN|nr:hypothetical protein P43SY_008336 [Pythium insidiosum]